MKLTGEDLQRLKQGINALKPNRRLTLREQIGAIYAPLMKAKGRGLTNAQLLDYLREQGIVISAPSLFRVLKQLAEQKSPARREAGKPSLQREWEKARADAPRKSQGPYPSEPPSLNLCRARRPSACAATAMKSRRSVNG